MPEKSNILKSLSTHTIIFQITGLQFFALDRLRSSTFIRKHKFNFGIIFVILSLAVSKILLIHLVKEKQKRDGQNVTSSFKQIISNSIVLGTILLLMIHSYVKTKKAKSVFISLDQASKLFSKNLNSDLNYSRLGRELKRFSLSILIVYLVIKLIFLLLVYKFGSQYSVLLTFCTFLPHLFIITCFVRFMFYVLLVRFHVEYIETVLKRIRDKRNPIMVVNKIFWHLQDKPMAFVKSNDNIDFFLGLKKIYGILTKATDAVNNVCGFANVILLGLIILANINGGYKLILSLTKHTEFDEIACW